MQITQADVKIKKIASVFGIIQGLAWTLMSLICMIYYSNDHLANLEPKSYHDYIGFFIYQLLLNNNEVVFTKQAFTDGVFFGFMLIYFFLDLAWIAVSVRVWLRHESKSIKAWSLVTLLICVWDFLTVVILGADYDNCLRFAKTSNSKLDFEFYCSTALLTVLVIAAKGFVLWFINLFLAWAMFKVSKEIK
ncbi:hypothetical protein TcasGA2_TC031072 [Tribolium castaneum]|uniref:Uncharacterized protein n=1 Tax=Tribolium castaneum TaxID=7070 RepID=A0A139WKE1_TRICA|nr:PREDICTED: uncharacterized protein LOC107397703 [Tribolium castaneum]KYB28265.1 hypothetical protein TcasGA2_TC031072 [Tribolium castaneum]|eukprot:XP_015834262.1 PREDICTED: uncharacterized protein LOC107397703 [Tribolium castaneum]